VAPPQQFLDEQNRLKAIFNIGAGVDALMMQLPPDVPVVPDEGMSVQMVDNAPPIRHSGSLTDMQPMYYRKVVHRSLPREDRRSGLRVE
jgi:hypothetical protein